MTVPLRRAEQARATMLELFPEGFEEVENDGTLELAAYTDGNGEERVWRVFGGVSAAEQVEAGWEERWRAFHHPVRVGALWVGPPWEEPPEGALPVLVDPGRAFGTGAHPTTRLCLELIQELERGSLLDAGCGSGVLAIAAARLGFAPVLALDSDPQAVEATAANAAANGVEVEARTADVLALRRLPRVDVAVANISAEAAAGIGPALDCLHAVTSGYLLSDAPSPPGFELVERRELDGWAADLHRSAAADRRR